MASEPTTAARGIVHLVGAGPGDPGLLTVRARALLDACDAIVHDALLDPALLRLAAGAGRARAPELHDVGKRGGASTSACQEDINALLVRLAREGKRVVRLKGGDPFVFGRGSEEAQALARAGIAFEVVPGVTAGIAAPAYAGIPVTHRGVATAVTFVTGHEDPASSGSMTDWAALARGGGTIVLYMGVRTLPRIAAALADGGMPDDTPAAAIEWGTWPRQRTVRATLGTIAARAAAEGLGAPVITVIGAVAALGDEIEWFERRPLFGRTIAVTRATARAGPLADRLRELGAEVVEMPATRIEPLDPAPLRRALDALTSYGWAIFTSRNAVRLTWEALRALGRDARAFAGIRVCAVGPATADALIEIGVVPDVLPDRFVAEGLLEALRSRADVAGTRALYVAAEGARDVLPEGLAALGAEVDRVAAYRSVPDGEGAAELRAALESGRVALITFASASAVRALVELVGARAARRAPAASIGPATSEAVRAAGLPLAVEAMSSTIPGLVEAILRSLGAGGTPADTSSHAPPDERADRAGVAAGMHDR